ncbi:MAG: hypothetical protein KJN90_01420, partial [Gammaproteobacteria bacterium]|nr:hypothetical protein [Gammaproteobacteria bacterium]
VSLSSDKRSLAIYGPNFLEIGETNGGGLHAFYSLNQLTGLYEYCSYYNKSDTTTSTYHAGTDLVFTDTARYLAEPRYNPSSARQMLYVYELT